MKPFFAEVLAFLRGIAVLPIRFYQKRISPLKPPSCRFIPTCSNYAIAAVRRFGIFAGGLMALARLLRCHPWAKPGYDPLPAHFTLRPFAGIDDPAPEPTNNTEE